MPATNFAPPSPSCNHNSNFSAQAMDGSTLDADLAAAQRAVSRLSRLSTTLLELSRIEAATASGSGTFTELETELADAVDQARFAARASGLTIDYEVADSSDDGAHHIARFAVSPHDFGRVVDNLVENAARAASSSGAAGVVDIRLSATAGFGLLSVGDTGPGMPDDFVPRAFDRFTRASEARDGDGGSGLGLTIVHAIVHRAGGTIALANAHQSGLVVRVELPFLRG